MKNACLVLCVVSFITAGGLSAATVAAGQAVTTGTAASGTASQLAPVVTPLKDKVALTGQRLLKGQMAVYSVPATVESLRAGFAIWPPSQPLKLYGAIGRIPTTTDYDYTGTANDCCSMSLPVVVNSAAPSMAYLAVYANDDAKFQITGFASNPYGGVAIVGSTGAPGATVKIENLDAQVDQLGNYTRRGLSDDDYYVTPTKDGCTFSPPYRRVDINGTSVQADFTASCDTGTYSIQGGTGTPGVTVTAGSASATSDASTNYRIDGLKAGTYAVTPSKTDCLFSPASSSVTVPPNNQAASFQAWCGRKLENGVQLIRQSVRMNGVKQYYLPAPAGADVTFTTTNPDARIYAGFNGPPVPPYGCVGTARLAPATCSPPTASAGTWWVEVRGAGTGQGNIEFAITGTTTLYSIQGDAGDAGVTVSAGSRSAVSNASRRYAIDGLPAGAYTVRPSQTGCVFNPAWLGVQVPPNNARANFTAYCGIPLEPGLPNTQTLTAGNTLYYSIYVPRGMRSLTFTAKTTGRVIIVAYPQPWSTSSACSAPANASCTVARPSPGTWWLKVSPSGQRSVSVTVSGTLQR